MSEVKLGQLIDGPAERDAIHIAVAPVVATVRMRPGCRVGLDEEGAAEISESSRCIGIVDPFLTEDVLPGQRFFLVLFPNTVTSLRHSWEHPAFNLPVGESRKFLELMAAGCGVTYKRLMEAAECYVDSGDYLHMGSFEDYKDAFWGREAEFWKHYEIVTGTKVKDNEASFFSCSC